MSVLVVGAPPMVVAFVAPLELAAVYSGRRVLPLVLTGLPAVILSVLAVGYWNGNHSTSLVDDLAGWAFVLGVGPVAMVLLALVLRAVARR
jgi:apolipoprotein N-acyltransferase